MEHSMQGNVAWLFEGWPLNFYCATWAVSWFIFLPKHVIMVASPTAQSISYTYIPTTCRAPCTIKYVHGQKSEVMTGCVPKLFAKENNANKILSKVGDRQEQDHGSILCPVIHEACGVQGFTGKSSSQTKVWLHGFRDVVYSHCFSRLNTRLQTFLSRKASGPRRPSISPWERH